jgi:hypothetical protein
MNEKRGARWAALAASLYTERPLTRIEKSVIIASGAVLSTSLPHKYTLVFQEHNAYIALGLLYHIESDLSIQ